MPKPGDMVSAYNAVTDVVINGIYVGIVERGRTKMHKLKGRGILFHEVILIKIKDKYGR